MEYAHLVEAPIPVVGGIDGITISPKAEGARRVRHSPTPSSPESVRTKTRVACILGMTAVAILHGSLKGAQRTHAFTSVIFTQGSFSLQTWTKSWTTGRTVSTGQGAFLTTTSAVLPMST